MYYLFALAVVIWLMTYPDSPINFFFTKQYRRQDRLIIFKNFLYAIRII